jgi:hypothetical protein
MSAAKSEPLRRIMLIIVLFLNAAACTLASENGVRQVTNTPSPHIQVTPVSSQLVVIADFANLRSGPGIDFDSIGTLAKDEIITIDGVSADAEWYRMLGGAWIKADFVSAVQVERIAPSPIVTQSLMPTDTATLTPSLMFESTASPSPPPTETVSVVQDCIPSPPVNWMRYTIRHGDTLFSLALQRGTSVSRIQEVNCRDGTLIRAGEQIWLPAATNTPTPIPQPTTATHTLMPPSTPTSTPTGTPTPTETPTLATPDTPTPTPTGTPPRTAVEMGGVQ